MGDKIGCIFSISQFDSQCHVSLPPARPPTRVWLSFVPDDSPESDLLYFVAGLRGELALATLLLRGVSNVAVPRAP